MSQWQGRGANVHIAKGKDGTARAGSATVLLKKRGWFFNDALGLLYAARRKVYFHRAVPGREPTYSFSDIDMGVAQ